MIGRPGSTILSASILILLCGIAAPLLPEERDTLAVFDLRAAGVSTQTAAAASNALRREMRRLEKFAVIDPARANALLKEKGFAQDCADRQCALRAGLLLSARKIAAGEMGALGNSFVITVSVIDTERDLAEYTARATASSLGDIDAAAARIVDALRTQVEGKDLPRPSIAESDIPAPMYICGNPPRRGDIIILEKNQGMAALAGARARVKGLFTQHNVTYIDVIWIDAKAKTQGTGGYLADKFRLVSRQERGDSPAR
ncbi:MAG: hypothetical protein KBA61_02110 [Spirochaetes bacterium]|nr:hypothetical protein [Spirochaetota bacterium]